MHGEKKLMVVQREVIPCEMKHSKKFKHNKEEINLQNLNKVHMEKRMQLMFST